MNRTLSFFVALFLLPACTNNTATQNNPANADSSTNPTKPNSQAKPDSSNTSKSPGTTASVLKLEYFKKIPDTIDGCSDSYTYDTTKLSPDKYIFLSNFTSFAIIKVDGKSIYLTKDTLNSKETSTKSSINIYEGNGYKAILKIKEVKAYDEGGLFKGTLEIISDKPRIILNVHGESGC